ncbi:MAG: hypothetical protein ACRCZF_10300, partial [Gemmataceae bacterium]
PALHGAKVWIVQGEQDGNVTPRSVNRGIAILEATGAQVRQWRDPTGDHFLFFARRAAIFDWLRAEILDRGVETQNPSA